VNVRSISRKPSAQVTTPPSRMASTIRSTLSASVPTKGATTPYRAAPATQNSRGRRAEYHGSRSAAARSAGVGSRSSMTQATDWEKAR
jgi:hypothetical protein